MLLAHDFTQSGRERRGERDGERQREGAEWEREIEREGQIRREKRKARKKGGKKETMKKRERIDSHHFGFSFSSSFPVSKVLIYFHVLPSCAFCQHGIGIVGRILRWYHSYVFGCYLTRPTLTWAEQMERKERKSERRKRKTKDGKDRRREIGMGHALKQT